MIDPGRRGMCCRAHRWGQTLSWIQIIISTFGLVGLAVSIAYSFTIEKERLENKNVAAGHKVPQWLEQSNRGLAHQLKKGLESWGEQTKYNDTRLLVGLLVDFSIGFLIYTLGVVYGVLSLRGVQENHKSGSFGSCIVQIVVCVIFIIVSVVVKPDGFKVHIPTLYLAVYGFVIWFLRMVIIEIERITRFEFERFRVPVERIERNPAPTPQWNGSLSSLAFSLSEDHPPAYDSLFSHIV